MSKLTDTLEEDEALSAGRSAAHTEPCEGPALPGPGHGLAQPFCTASRTGSGTKTQLACSEIHSLGCEECISYAIIAGCDYLCCCSAYLLPLTLILICFSAFLDRNFNIMGNTTTLLKSNPLQLFQGSPFLLSAPQKPSYIYRRDL